ncbi:MAG TPA: hypothetical protein VEB20_05065 [Azospirillaceae bacterium]|nr:hypothetical protein [Azospirillaceae bacterium]
MTKPFSIFDLVDEDAKARAVEEARQDAAAGRVVDHDTVMEWLARLAAGERLPPPVPPEA